MFIRDPNFFPSWIPDPDFSVPDPDPGVKIVLDPGSATLQIPLFSLTLIRGTDKIKPLTLLSQSKLALTASKTLLAL
jgi:hypothetical protein